MSEPIGSSIDVTKKIAVTFRTGLPMGTSAVFTHEKQMWIAYPAKKNDRILAVIDRMIGIYSKIERQMLDWLRNNPDDVRRVAMILASVDQAQKLRQSLLEEKTEARTE